MVHAYPSSSRGGGRGESRGGRGPRVPVLKQDVLQVLPADEHLGVIGG